MRTRTALIAALIAAMALVAAPAGAAPYETMIQDDNVLVYGSDSDVATGMSLLHALGVDRADHRPVEPGRAAPEGPPQTPWVSGRPA